MTGSDLAKGLKSDDFSSDMYNMYLYIQLRKKK